MYVRLPNALYGIMKAALLFYLRFVKDLTSVGFELNPYDPCVANKILQGTQMTIVWHVDDLKVSHRKASALNKMIKWLKRTYQRVFHDGSGEMSISLGKIHQYLGMTIDFSVPGQVIVTMIPYVKEIIQQFEQYDKTKLNANTPAAEHLFKVDDPTTSRHIPQFRRQVSFSDQTSPPRHLNCSGVPHHSRERS